MKQSILITLALMVVLFVAGPVRAQTHPTIETPQIAFVTLDLDAGNPLDPFIVSLNGGGPVAASTLNEECVGYITEMPTLTVNWSGEADFVKAFFYSEHDPILVVQQPDGSVQCNDDANELLLDPTVSFTNPEAGEYKIWVGTFDEGQLIPGILVLTTRPEVNLGTFNLGTLVQRPPIAENLVKSEDVTPPTLPSVPLTQTVASSLTLPFTTTATVSGTIPAFEFSPQGQLCNGLLEETPTFAFDWAGNGAGEAESLNLFFASTKDSTLLVEMPDGSILCNDDSARDEIANDEVEEDINLNPLVIIDNPLPGRYYVYVGRLDDEAAVDGILTITNADASTLPVLTIEQATAE